MANLEELKELAHEFNLPIVTIDALVAYRQHGAEDLQIAGFARDLANDVRAPPAMPQG